MRLYDDVDPTIIELQERVGSETLIVPLSTSNAVASLNGLIGAINLTQSGLVSITAGSGTITIAVASPVSLANGGTGGTDANTAKTNLGIQFGLAPVSMPDANYTLSSAEYQARIVEFSGTLTAGRDAIVPTTSGMEWVINNKTGQVITVKTSAGTGVAIGAGKVAIAYCDGTNVVRVTADA